MVGLFAFLVAVSVLIPFPGTNFPPSIALVIVSIAVMEEDGYLLIGGYLIGLAGLAYTADGARRLLPPDPWRPSHCRAGSGSEGDRDFPAIGALPEALRRLISPPSSTSTA